MNLKAFFSAGVSSNCYLLEGGKAALIDAGLSESILRELTKIDYLILTHCHFDHIGMAKRIQEKTGCQILMSKAEADFFEAQKDDASAAKYFDFDVDIGFKINKTLKTGDIISIGDTKLKTVVCPGHTPGGLCLYDPESKSLFSGDTVFAQGYGRYDLLGGDRTALQESISKLAKLDVSAIYPGHGQPLKKGANEHLRSLTI